MSIHAVSLALKLRGMSPSEKLILLVLSNYADERNQSYPSQRRISEESGLTPRTVMSVLRALEERRLISRLERRRADGSRSTDLITLHFQGEIVSPPPEIDDDHMVKLGVGGPEIISPLTTFEPSSNHQIEPSSVAKATSDSPRGSRISEHWNPGPDGLAFAEAEGLTLPEGVREAAKFLDYWRTVPGAKGRKLDWGLTWKGWVRRAAEAKPGAPHERDHRISPPSGPPDSRRANTETRRNAWTDIVAERDGYPARDDRDGVGDRGADRGGRRPALLAAPGDGG